MSRRSDVSEHIASRQDIVDAAIEHTGIEVSTSIPAVDAGVHL